MKPKTIEEVKQAQEARLMAMKGVEGVGIGADQLGNPAIVVYVRDAGAAARLPKQIEGHPVVVENLGGPIDALPK
jgi:peptide deformylase